jgi:hypothetical protein
MRSLLRVAAGLQTGGDRLAREGLEQQFCAGMCRATLISVIGITHPP